MRLRWICVLIIAGPAVAQEQTGVEQQELMLALNDANNSPVDIIRVIEAFLKKHPQTTLRGEAERTLAKAAIESRDDRRTVLYGEPILASSPQDVPLLDRVTAGLLALGGRENAEKAFKYGHSLEILIIETPPPEGADAARRQDERDRALARILLYESRAKAALGAKEEAEQLAARAFPIYPSEEAAREWSEVLERLGRDDDAVQRLAEAFAIVDPHSTDADRAADRKRLRELYRKRHDDSEAGLGDLILAAYDRTRMLLEDRRRHFQTMDPNFGVTEPSQFVLSGLEGKKLVLGGLKGRIVVMDFWATWCVPCRTQHPLYEAVKQRFKDRSDVVFLAIDADEDRTLVEPFLDSQKWSHSIYFEDGLQRLLQVTSIPTTILFDKRGRVWSRMNGFAPDRFVDMLSERIQTALADN